LQVARRTLRKAATNSLGEDGKPASQYEKVSLPKYEDPNVSPMKSNDLKQLLIKDDEERLIINEDIYVSEFAPDIFAYLR
jgi:1-phosphatidylinositol-4-phosphate 5-kinase